MTDLDRPQHTRGPDEPLTELLQAVTGDLATLFRQELELAKVEIKEEVRQAKKVGGMLGAGALSALFGLLFLSYALAWLLDQIMPTALAFFLVGAVYAVIATVLFLRGREQAKHLHPVPQQTVETLKEDVQWAKQQTN